MATAVGKLQARREIRPLSGRVPRRIQWRARARTRAYPGRTPIFTPGPPWVRRARDRAARHRPREGMGSSHGRARVERRERSRASGSDPGHPAPPRDALSPPPGGFFPSGIPRAPAVIPWCTSDVQSDHRASRTLNVPRLKPGDARVESGRRDFSNARGTRRSVVY